MTIALHFTVASRNGAAQRGSARLTRTASVGQFPAGLPGVPRRIMPAPAANAPRVHKMADPSMPIDPDATPSAVLHLFDWRGRGGSDVPDVGVLDQGGTRRARGRCRCPPPRPRRCGRDPRLGGVPGL